MSQNGSWACPNCTVVNGHDNLNCATCLAKRPLRGREDPRNEQTVPPSSSKATRILRRWECPRCSFINNGSSDACESCGSERTNGRRQSWWKDLRDWVKERWSSASDHQWACPNCTLYNSTESAQCGACGLPYIGRELRRKNALFSDQGSPLQPRPSPDHPHPAPPLPAPPPSRGVQDLPSAHVGGDGPTSSLSFHTTRIDEERQKHRCDAAIVYERVRQYQRECGEPFVDPDFPPADCSLYINPNKPVVHWKGVVDEWLRPANISDPYNGPWTVFHDPSEKDIMQGALGNCWMLSALAVIAQQPSLLREIIISDQYCPEGIYQLRLCIDGEWTIVNVDDSFPCHSNGRLVFSKTNEKQLWVPLVEKALAKLYHSYEALHSGSLMTGLSVLTGLPCEKVLLKGNDDTKSPASVDSELIWARLLSFKDSSFPMAAACGEYNIQPEVIQSYEAAGLELDHAYSVLDVMTTHDGSRKIKLRNPWGRTTRNRWGFPSGNQRHMEHNVVPDFLRPFISDIDLYHLTTPTGSAEDVFTLDFPDFLRYFNEVAVCKYRPEWESTRMKGQLYPFARPHLNLLAFEVLETSELDVSIYQPTVSAQSSSSSGGHHTPQLVDLSVLVMQCSSNPLQAGFIPQPQSCMAASGSHIDSIVTCSCVLKPGYYVVLPMAFNHWCQLPGDSGGGTRVMEEQEGLVHTTALFAAKPLLYSSRLWSSPGFLAESLFLLALKEGNKMKPFQGVEHCLYQVSLPRACYILIAENKDRHMHFTVSANCSESVNIVSTRGELITTDCIPPRHRQVLAVLSTLEKWHILTSRLQYQSTHTNPFGQWGASHTPWFHPLTEELHCPRLISC